MRNYPKDLFEIILVDDASDDESVSTIQNILDTKSSKKDFTRIECPYPGQQALAAKNFVNSRDATGESVGRIKDNRVYYSTNLAEYLSDRPDILRDQFQEYSYKESE